MPSPFTYVATLALSAADRGRASAVDKRVGVELLRRGFAACVARGQRDGGLVVGPR
jgi:hypothetical protein